MRAHTRARAARVGAACQTIMHGPGQAICGRFSRVLWVLWMPQVRSLRTKT